ncbi:MAG: porin family protein [Dysgonomonas sp.]
MNREIIRILVVVFAFGTIFNAKAQVTILGSAGANISRLNNSSADSRFGYQLGGYIDYALPKSWSVYSGLLLTTKGTKNYEGNDDSSVNAIYLEVPVMCAYNINLSKSTNLRISLGPYFAVGIGGNTRITRFYKVESGQRTERRNYNTFADDVLKTFDYGADIRIGIETRAYLISFASQFGIPNISGGAFDRSARNQNYSITFAYKFYSK